MGQSLIEQILSEACGHAVRPGEVVVARVDRVLLHDGTAPRVLDRIDALERATLELASRSWFFTDHASPPPTPSLATAQRSLMERCRALGLRTGLATRGISHQVMAETLIAPGEILVGADNHTCTAGALACLGLGMGSTDVACAIALGQVWLTVPGSIKIELRGRLAEGVLARDAMQSLVGRLGGMGANDHALEFGGEGLAGLSQSSRFVLANLAAEVGAKAALIPTDGITESYFEAQGRSASFKPLECQEATVYTRHLKLDLGKIAPMLARPGRHDDTAEVAELLGQSVQQVVIGSCTNGRAEDFAQAARVLAGKRIDRGTRLVLVPASTQVLRESMEDGSLPALIDAGGVLVSPGCGPCIGIHQGVLGEDENCVATQARNFPGRMGARSARIFLASPLTAAAAALHGQIVDPREVLDGA